MNEILVEEENTVYELDLECLKRKEEQEKKQSQQRTQEKSVYKVQKVCKNRWQSNVWFVCLLFLIFCS